MHAPFELLSSPNYHEIKANFIQELEYAKQGQTSSISYIRHHLPEKPLVSSGIIQGIVIGGTNYILSTVALSADGKQMNLIHKTDVLPTLENDKVFFDFLDEHLDGRAIAIGI